MRFVVILLIIFCSCRGLSRSDKEYIRIRVETHNVMAKAKYYEAMHDEIELLNAIYGPGNKAFKKVDLTAWQDRWNDPYRIQRDTALTLDRFLDYCGVHRLNPKQYIDDMGNR